VCGAVFTGPDNTVVRDCRRLRTGEVCTLPPSSVACDFDLDCRVVGITSDGRKIRECQPLHAGPGNVGDRCTSPGECKLGLLCGAVFSMAEETIRECRLARSGESCAPGTQPTCDFGLACLVIGITSDGRKIRECRPSN
jgi:hypothetical protein